VCKFEVYVCRADEDLCLLGYDPIVVLVKDLDYAEYGSRSLLRNVRKCMRIYHKMRPKLHSTAVSFLFYDQAKTLQSEAVQFVCVCVLASLP
jgi:hypothetical protein